jgi:hypothetical protein
VSNKHEIRVASAVSASLSPDLLSKKWASIVQEGDHPTTGHCYAAAEAAFHLLGGRRKGYVAFVASYDGLTHWWVRHASGRIVDPTRLQYGPEAARRHGVFWVKPPYHLGRGTGFLTKKPSRRARILMARAKPLTSIICRR